MSSRDVYIAKFKAQIDELNAQMSQAKAKALEAKEDMREKYNEEIEKLGAQTRQASAKLDELKAAGEDHWEALVDEVEKVGDTLKNSFKNFMSRF